MSDRFAFVVACGRPWTRFASIAAALALAGCVQAPTRVRTQPLDSDGAVLLKIGENLPAGTGRLDTVTVRRLPDAASKDATCYDLQTSLRGLSAGTFLAGALPPGTYEFPTIGAQHPSIGACNGRVLLAKAGSQFGKFTVERGKLTYLGALERTGGMRYHSSLMVPVGPVTPQGPDEVLREAFPNLARFAGTPPLGWIENTLPAPEKAFRYGLTNSFGLFDPSQAPDGTWIFGSRAGVVRSWKAGWDRAIRHNTGYRVALMTTAVLPDGQWLVGGEQSTLLLSADQGVTWKSVRGNLPFGAISKVVPVGNEQILTLLDGKNVSIYRGDAHAATWRKVAGYTTEFAFWTGMPGVAPQSFLVGDAYVTSLPSRHLGIYNLATGAVETRDLPGSVQVFGAGKDGVLRCRCAATIAVNPYASTDLGKTWTSSSFSRYMALPGMADASHGVAWYKQGLFSDPVMAYTKDGGATWVQTGPAPNGLSHIFYSRDGKTVFASNEADVIWSSDDNGATWKSALSVPLPPGDMVLY